MEKLMTIEELAEKLNYTAQTVRRWVLNKEIPFHKMKGGIRFRPSEIDRWIDTDGSFCSRAKADGCGEGGLFPENAGTDDGPVADNEAAETANETAGGNE